MRTYPNVRRIIQLVWQCYYITHPHHSKSIRSNSGHDFVASKQMLTAGPILRGLLPNLRLRHPGVLKSPHKLLRGAAAPSRSYIIFSQDIGHRLSVHDLAVATRVISSRLKETSEGRTAAFRCFFIQGNSLIPVHIIPI